MGDEDSREEIWQGTWENHKEENWSENVLELMNIWERRRQLVAVQLVCYMVHSFYLLEVAFQFQNIDRPITTNIGEKESVRRELMKQLSCNKKCHDVIRMGPYAFAKLCELLRGTGRLRDNKNALVEEQVAKFLYALAHSVKNRTMQFFFRRSGETVSRHFHAVLRAIISLEDQFLKQPVGSEVPPQIFGNSRFYPYFKDCVGAIDGTHIRVKVSRIDAPRYRGRKNYPTQNVLAACSFDMKFTYVLPGWEGTASDSRILKNALSRAYKLRIPTGKYYLVDGGFMLRSGFIAPYRGVRYHLKEYSMRDPENSQELFNHRHASLRNVIERAFGVLKKRFPIISSGAESHLSVGTLTEVVLACCILHNYLMGIDPDERLINEVDEELMNRDIGTEECPNTNRNPDVEARQGAIIRDNIAARMWEDYCL